MDHTDQFVKFKAENLLSQALEHEIDHLNGILYTDHLAAHQELYPIPIVEENQQEQGEESIESPASLKID